MGRLLVVVLLLLAVSWSSAAPGSAHTGSQPFPADIVARMRELVEGDMHSLNETGALVSVSMPGSVRGSPRSGSRTATRNSR
jgi:hypothetical protein